MTEGDTDEQPERMEIVADLLVEGLHGGIPADRGQAMAEELRTSAATLRAAIEAARGPGARAKQLGKMRTSLARVAQIQLQRLKRSYKAEGFSEVDIHEVIPDRPRPVPPSGTPTSHE